MIGWLVANWAYLFWGVLILFVLGSIRYVFGEKATLPALIAGVASIMYIIGRKSGRDNLRKYHNDILEKRKQAYEEIDSQPTSVDDVVDRLRRNGF